MSQKRPRKKITNLKLMTVMKVMTLTGTLLETIISMMMKKKTNMTTYMLVLIL